MGVPIEAASKVLRGVSSKHPSSLQVTHVYGYGTWDSEAMRRSVRLMIISNDNRTRHGLGNEGILPILYCENDPGMVNDIREVVGLQVFDLLETKLFALVTTVASNSHGDVNLHGTIRIVHLELPSLQVHATIRSRDFRSNRGWNLPLFDLCRVEDYNSTRFVFLPWFFLLWLLGLLPGCTLSFPHDAAVANMNLASILWQILLVDDGIWIFQCSVAAFFRW